MNRWVLALLLWVSVLPVWASNRTQTRLVLAEQTARPGETVWAGLEMKMPPSWHTYWRNGGDAGIPTTIDWHLPNGVTAADIQWPIPHKQVDKISDETTLVTYVYSNSVVLLAPLRIDASVPAGSLEIKGTAHWQECSDICVMAQDDVTATLTIGSQDQKSPDADLIEQWRQRLPSPTSAAPVSIAWENAAASGDTPRRLIFIRWPIRISTCRELRRICAPPAPRACAKSSKKVTARPGRRGWRESWWEKSRRPMRSRRK
jgi:DsbC/DsbD-like thiol-disulfide interchange protein